MFDWQIRYKNRLRCWIANMNKSSHSQMFFKICDVLHKYFAIFTGKNLCWSLFFNKVATCFVSLLKSHFDIGVLQ